MHETISIDQTATNAIPHVSVNISIYNCEPYLRQTLDSLLAQTYTDWECIIVDDASTDQSAAIADEYAANDARFRVVRLDAATKKPYPACRNKAIELSRGHWIAPLDGDDWWEPWKLERQVALAESEPQIVICCARAHFWCEGKILYPSASCTRQELAETLPMKCITMHPAVMFNRQAVMELGMYDPIMQTAQDWDLWLKILWRHGPEGFAFLEEPCMYYRRHANNVTASKNIIKCSKHEWIIIRRTLRHYGWGIKNPRMAWRVLSFWLSQDAENYRIEKIYGIAIRRAMAAVAIYPIGKWRWQQLVRIMREQRANRSNAKTA